MITATATGRLTASGVFTTATPLSVQDGTSTESKPTPQRAIRLSLPSAGKLSRLNLADSRMRGSNPSRSSASMKFFLSRKAFSMRGSSVMGLRSEL